MARVKVGVTAHARHKKILKMAKGYRGARHAQFKKANELVMKALYMQEETAEQRRESSASFGLFVSMQQLE